MSADFVTANSEHLLSEALEKTKLSHKKHCCVVPMAFSTEGYNKIEIYQHKKPYLFSAGRFVYKKGLDVLIKAFAQLLKNDSYQGDLIIAGDGEEHFTYQSLAEELGVQDRVVFYGLANWTQMVRLLKGCDVFIIPSRLEAFGIVLLEALYADKKVIASKVGGLVELMVDNPNYLVEPDNIEALSLKIRQALTGEIHWNKVDLEKLRKTYNWEKVAESYLRIYKRLISLYVAQAAVSEMSGLFASLFL